MAELEQLLAEMAKKGAGKVIIKQMLAGTATNITATTCTVEREGSAPLYNVRLNAIDDDLKSYVTIYPADKSNVLVAVIENEKTEAVVVKCSEVESVKMKIGDQTLVMDKNGFVFNGGNDGMIKIANLVTKLNNLITAFNNHTHTVSTTGTASAQSGTASAITSKFQSIDKSYIEDTKIKH